MIMNNISHSFSLNTKINGDFFGMNKREQYLQYMNDIAICIFSIFNKNDQEITQK